MLEASYAKKLTWSHFASSSLWKGCIRSLFVIDTAIIFPEIDLGIHNRWITCSKHIINIDNRVLICVASPTVAVLERKSKIDLAFKALPVIFTCCMIAGLFRNPFPFASPIIAVLFSVVFQTPWVVEFLASIHTCASYACVDSCLEGLWHGKALQLCHSWQRWSLWWQSKYRC